MGRFYAPALASIHNFPPPAYPAATPRGEKHATGAGSRPVRDGSGGYRGTVNAFGFLSSWRQPCFAGFVSRPGADNDTLSDGRRTSYAR